MFLGLALRLGMLNGTIFPAWSSDTEVVTDAGLVVVTDAGLVVILG